MDAQASLDDAGVKLDVSRKNALQFLAKGLRSNQIRDLKLKASKFYKGFPTSGTWKNYTLYIIYIYISFIYFFSRRPLLNQLWFLARLKWLFK